MGITDKGAFAQAAQTAFLNDAKSGLPLDSAQILRQLDQAKAQIG